MRILVPITHALHERNWVASGALDVIRDRGHEMVALRINPTSMSPARRAIRASLRLASMIERAKRGSSTYRHKLTLPRSVGDRLQVRVWRALGRVCDVEAVAHSIEARLPVTKAAGAILETYRPDLLLWPTLIHSDPADDLAKAALVRGIPVVAALASWDTLTSKGGFLIRPDHVLVWGQASARHAARDHDLPAGQIHVTGPPHWDSWLETRPARPRTKVYVNGTSVHYWVDEALVVRRLQEDFPGRVIYSRHPRRRGADGWSWKVFHQLRDHIDEAAILIAAFSTTAIEAALSGVPSCLVAFGAGLGPVTGGGVAPLAEYEHMAEVVRWPGIAVCRDYDGLVDRINYVLGTGVPEPIRKDLATCAREVADMDGHCRERITDAIESIGGAG